MRLEEDREDNLRRALYDVFREFSKYKDLRLEKERSSLRRDHLLGESEHVDMYVWVIYNM